MKESGEMYLETILVLEREKNRIRAIDIAEKMEFSKPSVSRALGILKVEGYISVDTSGFISLTSSGRLVAEKMYERHIFLSEMLMSLGVDKETAISDACKIEHDISDKSFEALKLHKESH